METNIELVMKTLRPIWTRDFLDQAREDAANALGFSSWDECHDEIFQQAQGSIRDAIAIMKRLLNKTSRRVKLSKKTIEYIWKNPQREAGNIAGHSAQKEAVRDIILNHTPDSEIKEYLTQLYHFRFGISIDKDTKIGDLKL